MMRGETPLQKRKTRLGLWVKTMTDPCTPMVVEKGFKQRMRFGTCGKLLETPSTYANHGEKPGLSLQGHW